VDHPVTVRVLREYLDPLLAASIDTLILGCTHFPVLKGAIRKVVGESVAIVDAARETALTLKEELPAAETTDAAPTHRFYVSDVPHRFREEAELFLGSPLGPVERVDMEILEEIGRE
jgi:glutamate racemase